jgi:hypothetical protein
MKQTIGTRAISTIIRKNGRIQRSNEEMLNSLERIFRIFKVSS